MSRRRDYQLGKRLATATAALRVGIARKAGERVRADLGQLRDRLREAKAQYYAARFAAGPEPWTAVRRRALRRVDAARRALGRQLALVAQLARTEIQVRRGRG